MQPKADLFFNIQAKAGIGHVIRTKARLKKIDASQIWESFGSVEDGKVISTTVRDKASAENYIRKIAAQFNGYSLAIQQKIQADGSVVLTIPTHIVHELSFGVSSRIPSVEQEEIASTISKEEKAGFGHARRAKVLLHAMHPSYEWQELGSPKEGKFLSITLQDRMQADDCIKKIASIFGGYGLSIQQKWQEDGKITLTIPTHVVYEVSLYPATLLPSTEQIAIDGQMNKEKKARIGHAHGAKKLLHEIDASHTWKEQNIGDGVKVLQTIANNRTEAMEYMKKLTSSFKGYTLSIQLEPQENGQVQLLIPTYAVFHLYELREKDIAASRAPQVAEVKPQHKANEIPIEYNCPITQEVMEDPVTAKDGHNYERRAITEWLNKNPTSPLTRESMTVDTLKENKELKQEIQAFKENNPDLFSKEEGNSIGFAM